MERDSITKQVGKSNAQGRGVMKSRHLFSRYWYSWHLNWKDWIVGFMYRSYELSTIVSFHFGPVILLITRDKGVRKELQELERVVKGFSEKLNEAQGTGGDAPQNTSGSKG